MKISDLTIEQILGVFLGIYIFNKIFDVFVDVLYRGARHIFCQLGLWDEHDIPLSTITFGDLQDLGLLPLLSSPVNEERQGDYLNNQQPDPNQIAQRTLEQQRERD